MVLDYEGMNYMPLAIGLGQSQAILKQYAQNYGITVLNDAGFSVWGQYNINNYIPVNYVIDPYDTVRYGAATWNEGTIRSYLEQYLTTGVEEAPAVQPIEFSVVGANPVVGHSAVRFNLPKAANVALRVYSTSGALVRTLYDGLMPAGANTVRWNLQDNAGRPVGNGLYLYELKAGSQVAHRKVSVLK